MKTKWKRWGINKEIRMWTKKRPKERLIHFCWDGNYCTDEKMLKEKLWGRSDWCFLCICWHRIKTKLMIVVAVGVTYNTRREICVVCRTYSNPLENMTKCINTKCKSLCWRISQTNFYNDLGAPYQETAEVGKRCNGRKDPLEETISQSC